MPVALVAFLAGMRFVPESRDPDPGRFDIPGALLSIGALVALVYALIEAPETGWRRSDASSAPSAGARVLAPRS